jgi:hypothetical protein
MMEPEEYRCPKRAATMTNHASTRTTPLNDRRSEYITLDEVERVLILNQQSMAEQKRLIANVRTFPIYHRGPQTCCKA